MSEGVPGPFGASSHLMALYLLFPLLKYTFEGHLLLVIHISAQMKSLSARPAAPSPHNDSITSLMVFLARSMV